MRLSFLLSVALITGFVANPSPRADGCSGAPGTLDLCFGSSGLAAEDLLPGGFDASWDLAVQSVDGKIVVVGSSRAATETVSRFTVLRYLADGSGVDMSFGSGGFIRTTFAGTKNAEEANRVVLQTDGKIVALGKAKLSSKGNAKYGFAVARYLTNGTLDSSFGSGGKVLIELGNSDAWPGALALQGAKIVVGGRSGSSAVFARLNANGSLDSGFGVGGKATPLTVGNNGNVAIKDIAIDGSGRIVAVGGMNADVLVLRLNANGTLDTSFDSDGKATTDFAGYVDFAEELAIDGSGRIVAAGVAITTAQAGPSWDVGVVRYLPSGALDVSFGSGGKVTVDINNTIDQFSSVALQSDGRILVAGAAEAVDYSQADFAVVRLEDDGEIDGTFGVGGITLTDFAGGSDYAHGGIGLQDDGGMVKAIIAGRVGPPVYRIGLARYFLE